MATFELLGSDGATVEASCPIAQGVPTPIGREALGIPDKRLSRKQLVVTVLGLLLLRVLQEEGSHPPLL